MAQQQELSILEFQALSWFCLRKMRVRSIILYLRTTLMSAAFAVIRLPLQAVLVCIERIPRLCYCFWSIYLISRDKRGLSALTAWLILHKIREAMSLRDDNYKLANLVELDDGFF